jgi:predicted nucleic acid-binding protein
MIVVADTSPILYLVLIEQVELLQSFYSEVVIPDAVAIELRAMKSPSSVRTWISNPPSWAKVKPVTREQLDAVTAELDPGERAAIALATALSANLLLIDNARGRAEARRRHLGVTGTLGVLRTAAERGLISVPDVLGRLRATSFYVEDALVEEVFGTWL